MFKSAFDLSRVCSLWKQTDGKICMRVTGKQVFGGGGATSLFDSTELEGIQPFDAY